MPLKYKTTLLATAALTALGLAACGNSETPAESVEAAPAAIAQVDCNGAFRFVNATLRSWLNCREDDVIGKRLLDIYGAEFAHLSPWLERALSGEAVSFDATNSKLKKLEKDISLAKSSSSGANIC